MKKFDELYETTMVDETKLLEEDLYYDGPNWDTIKFKEYKIWIFNFIPSGSNSIEAQSKKQAIAGLKARYNRNGLKLDLKSFKVPTKEEYATFLRIGTV